MNRDSSFPRRISEKTIVRELCQQLERDGASIYPTLLVTSSTVLAARGLPCEHGMLCCALVGERREIHPGLNEFFEDLERSWSPISAHEGERQSYVQLGGMGSVAYHAARVRP